MIDEEDSELNGFMANPFNPSDNHPRLLSRRCVQVNPRSLEGRAESLLDSLGTSRATRDLKNSWENGPTNGWPMERQISRENRSNCWRDTYWSLLYCQNRMIISIQSSRSGRTTSQITDMYRCFEIFRWLNCIICSRIDFRICTSFLAHLSCSIPPKMASFPLLSDNPHPPPSNIPPFSTAPTLTHSPSFPTWYSVYYISSSRLIVPADDSLRFIYFNQLNRCLLSFSSLMLPSYSYCLHS